MNKLLQGFLLIILISVNSDAKGQYIYISFNSDSAITKRKCDVYFSKLKNGVTVRSVYVPSNGFHSFKCPIDKSFEIVLDCWESRLVLDKIFPNCGDSIIINLDNRTFSYLNKKNEQVILGKRVEATAPPSPQKPHSSSISNSKFAIKAVHPV